MNSTSNPPVYFPDFGKYDSNIIRPGEKSVDDYISGHPDLVKVEYGEPYDPPQGVLDVVRKVFPFLSDSKALGADAEEFISRCKVLGPGILEACASGSYTQVPFPAEPGGSLTKGWYGIRFQHNVTWTESEGVRVGGDKVYGRITLIPVNALLSADEFGRMRPVAIDATPLPKGASLFYNGHFLPEDITTQLVEHGYSDIPVDHETGLTYLDPDTGQPRQVERTEARRAEDGSLVIDPETKKPVRDVVKGPDGNPLMRDICFEDKAVVLECYPMKHRIIIGMELGVRMKRLDALNGVLPAESRLDEQSLMQLAAGGAISVGGTHVRFSGAYGRLVECSPLGLSQGEGQEKDKQQVIRPMLYKPLNEVQIQSKGRGV